MVVFITTIQNPLILVSLFLKSGVPKKHSIYVVYWCVVLDKQHSMSICFKMKNTQLNWKS